MLSNMISSHVRISYLHMLVRIYRFYQLFVTTLNITDFYIIKINILPTQNRELGASVARKGSWLVRLQKETVKKLVTF